MPIEKGIYRKDESIADIYVSLQQRGWLTAKRYNRKTKKTESTIPKIEEIEIPLLKVLLLIRREQESEYIKYKNEELKLKGLQK